MTMTKLITFNDLGINPTFLAIHTTRPARESRAMDLPTIVEY